LSYVLGNAGMKVNCINQLQCADIVLHLLPSDRISSRVVLRICPISVRDCFYILKLYDILNLNLNHAYNDNCSFIMFKLTHCDLDDTFVKYFYLCFAVNLSTTFR